MVDRAIRTNPSYGPAYRPRGYLRVWDGGSDTAIADFEQSMRFSPRDPFTFASMIGVAFGHFNACRYSEAAIWADRAIRAFPPYFIPGLQIAIMIYVAAGRIEDAQRVMADCLRKVAHWDGSTMRENNGLRSPELRLKMRQAQLKAGLPE
jgi:hypothetical protein